MEREMKGPWLLYFEFEKSPDAMENN